MIRAKKERISIIFLQMAPCEKFSLMSISWPSHRLLWLWMHWTSVFWPKETKFLIKMEILWTRWKWGLANVFWTPILMYMWMTSFLWLTLELDEKSDFEWVSTIWGKMTDQPCPCFEIEPTIQKPRFEPFLAYSGGFLKQIEKKFDFWNCKNETFWTQLDVIWKTKFGHSHEAKLVFSWEFKK